MWKFRSPKIIFISFLQINIPFQWYIILRPRNNNSSILSVTLISVSWWAFKELCFEKDPLIVWSVGSTGLFQLYKAPNFECDNRTSYSIKNIKLKKREKYYHYTDRLSQIYSQRLANAGKTTTQRWSNVIGISERWASVFQTFRAHSVMVNM